MHGTRSQKVPPTDTLMIKQYVGSSRLTGIVTRARRPSGINPTNHREHLHPSFIDHTRDRESKTLVKK